MYVGCMAGLFLNNFLGVRLDLRVTLYGEDFLHHLIRRHFVGLLF